MSDDLDKILAHGMKSLLSKHEILTAMVVMGNKITAPEREDLRVLNRYLDEVIGQVTYYNKTHEERQNVLEVAEETSKGFTWSEPGSGTPEEPTEALD